MFTTLISNLISDPISNTLLGNQNRFAKSAGRSADRDVQREIHRRGISVRALTEPTITEAADHQTGPLLDHEAEHRKHEQSKWTGGIMK